MAKEKRSFFEKLTGVHYEDEVVEQSQNPALQRISKTTPGKISLPPEPEEGQLTVDVYNTPDDIVIKTLIGGVKPEDLDISITRDMIIIRGSREETREVSDEDYFHRELYWGSFSRTITLPQEIDVDSAEATEKHGLLVLKLPKLDKSRQTKLKIRSL